MQPCSREMQGMASSLNGVSTSSSSSSAAQIALQELQNGHQQQIQNPNSLQVHDDFFDQVLSTLPSWPDLGNPKSPWDNSTADGSNGQKLTAAVDGLHYAPYDESTLLASRLRQHQINGGGGGSPAGKPTMFQLNQQQQMILSSMGRSPAVGGGGSGGESGLLPLPLTLGSGGLVDRSRDEVDASFKSPNSTGGEGLYNGFAGSLQRAANQQHFHHPQGGSMAAQNFGGALPAAGMEQAPPQAGVAAGGGTAAPPRQRVRARRGQATDPHSIAERLRRERIAERMKALQELVPNANKTDKASMLDEIIDYVKFLQLQVKVLSMSRLGGAAAVAPLVADISSEGQAGRGGSNGGGAPAGSDSITVTEHQVAKLMEEDMGSAMQYLQGKGLCLMPISLASAISTATCHPRGGVAAGGLINAGLIPNPIGADAPSSPSMSVLTVQSAVAGGGADGENVSRSSVKDAASVSKP